MTTTTSVSATTSMVPAPPEGTAARTVIVRAAGAAAVVVAAGLPLIADAYTVTVAATALVFAVLAVSTQLLVGVAGLPAFGQPAYLGVGAYTAALLAGAGVTDGPVLLAAATTTGAVAAAVTAPLVLRTRGTTFLMTTFAIQALTATVAAQWKPVTGGDDGLHTPPVTAWPAGPPLTGAAPVYWYTLAVFLLATTAAVLLARSRLGLVLRGCADHEPRMAALGHHVTVGLAAGYTAAGALAGAAGALLITVNRYVSPADLGFETAALVLLAAAIGAGTISGAVIGAVTVVAVRDLAGQATGGHSLALLGLLFLAVAYARPAAARVRTRLGRLP
ncbi:amino acid/amide ABC transporter membrane protein 2 (HAAT family) [Micromonospora sp. Llam0]|uniref:branched-chain amino acid ABC transporter permease n=1 Tax=Micromonospora sp. Llam0 TaxID=2485143 RepID=UPI000F4A0756|nr:branched-chain amino acid ABC transporter permease [Micromonospora sp. Llam0]ROO63051.1 amino acid/amide ABC transporter membrane protein 2 (HAAT family) [Micromonospora sp. Llam0]